MASLPLSASSKTARTFAPSLLSIGLISIVFGTLAALAQTELRRLLAYSAVANAGFLALALGCGAEGRAAAIFYVVTYATTALLAFAALAGRGPEPFHLRDIRIEGMGALRALALVLALLSLSGIPPTPGFWAKLAPGMPHTSYSAAKFAVKGFSEALLEDFRLNAPHVKVAVVMPGHIGTDIVTNSRTVHGGDGPIDADGIAAARDQMAQRGVPVETMDDDAVRSMIEMVGQMFRESAPMTAAQAATVILDGVREGRWRPRGKGRSRPAA